MSKMRTIDKAYEEIKASDPNTCISKFYIRQIVINGEIPFRKVGVKYIFNLDDLLDYLKGA